MKKSISIIALALVGVLALSACTTTRSPTLISQQYVVVMPPDKLRNCPTIKNYPNPNTLTDVQVAKLLNQLDRNNRVCKNNIEAIYAYLSQGRNLIK